MTYFIPSGTPIEVQQGRDISPCMTDQDLRFTTPAADTNDELIFHHRGAFIMVAKALVVGAPREDGIREA